jgi:pyruvate dehydrogenase E1 component beta subunit
MSEVRSEADYSEAEYVEAELIEGEPGSDADENEVQGGDESSPDAASSDSTSFDSADFDSTLLDTQAIDVVEIIESDPDARVLEEHVAEQEWTREFVIEDEPGEDPSPAPEATVDAPPEPRIQSLPMVKALNAGLRRALADDPRVLLMGEDIGPLGGVFRVTEGLLKEFGTQRVMDTPLAEAGIIGTAIGLAMRGYRPVLEIQFNGFVFPGFDQITTQLAKMTNRHSGKMAFPVVIRIPHGGHIGAVEHHQEAPEAYFAHTAGLRVVAPSTPHDAYWMIQEAIRSDDPVVFFEPMSRYWPKGEVDLVENGTPLHASRVVRTGTDATIVAWAGMVSVALRAAELAAEEGRSLEVIDLRSLSPVDYGPVIASVQKTGRLIVAQEAPGNVSVGSEVAATLAEKAFYSLEAPVLRVSGFDVPFPPANLEELYLPDADRILEAVDRALAY